MTTAQDTERRSFEEAPIHILHWARPPYTHALCGTPRDGEPLKPGATGEFCVVCEELRGRGAAA